MKETIVFPDGASSAPSLDPNLVMAMNNGGMGGFGGGGFAWWFVFLLLLRNGGWNGDGNGAQQICNSHKPVEPEKESNV